MSLASSIALSNLELTRFFIALVLLLFSAHLCSFLFDRIKLPRVISEILAGLLLGPSLFGYFYPSAEDWIFSAFPPEGQLLSLVTWFGLILLMFISGVEIHGTFNKEDRKIATSFLLGATVLPFLVGSGLTRAFNFGSYAGSSSNPISLSLVIGIAVAVTSIPVISKIFIDLKIMRTHYARIVLVIATIEDSILYAVLAIATGIAGASSPSTSTVAIVVALTAVFLLVGTLIVPRILRRLTTTKARVLMELSHSRFALFFLFLFVAVAALFNVNVVFGAFLAGIAIGTVPQDTFAKATESIKKISLALFTPAYFAIVGLQLDLVHRLDIVMFISFLLLSSSLKIGGALGVGRLIRKSWSSSVNLAIGLNARGGPGIVLATVAFAAGIISEQFFVALVLVAIVTSLVTGYWLRYVIANGRPLLEEDSHQQQHR